MYLSFSYVLLAVFLLLAAVSALTAVATPRGVLRRCAPPAAGAPHAATPASDMRYWQPL